MGGRTTYRTLSPKRTPFQTGIDWWSHLRKVPRSRRISHTYPVWLWGCSPCKISSPGPVFHGTKWLLCRPHIKSPALHSRCGINKGLIKRGSTIYHERSWCKGWILWPTPYTYIHTYIHTYIPLSSRKPGGGGRGLERQHRAVDSLWNTAAILSEPPDCSPTSDVCIAIA
jgi:hypothetical protein